MSQRMWRVKKGLLLLKNLKLELIGCKVGMEATYGSLGSREAFFDFHVNATGFDIKRAYNEIELFRNLTTAAGKCEGIVSLDYSLKGKLDEAMKPVYPSLEGGGVLTLKKVKVMGLKLFTAMSRNLGKDRIKNPDLSKVEIKSSIKNNVITIERTKMKMAGFRFRFEGSTEFRWQSQSEDPPGIASPRYRRDPDAGAGNAGKSEIQIRAGIRR